MKPTVLLVAVAVIAATVLLPKQRAWPSVRRLEERRLILSQQNADTPFLAVLKDSGGVAAYKLECHNGEYQGESEMNFSGDFQCALFELRGGSVASGNLLATNTLNELSTDWWNRGRMRSAQLRGACLNYPEYSTLRHFQLRGMLITFSFSEVRWSHATDRRNNPLIVSFMFTASVIPDRAAESARAARAVGPEPPASCYP